MKYISKHIFVHDSNEMNKLLKFIDDNNYFNYWFYIKYWYGGPHLRIRYNGEWNTEIDKYIKSIPMKNIVNLSYFDNIDIHLEFPNLKKSDMFLYKENSIHNIDYIPEVERYGGKYCLLKCEENFCLSTSFCMYMIKNFKKIEIILYWFHMLNTKLLYCKPKVVNSHQNYYKFDFERYKWISEYYEKNYHAIKSNCEKIFLKKETKNFLDSTFNIWKSNFEVVLSLLHMTANRLGISMDMEMVMYKLIGENNA